ncbi:rhamnan synthesis F family protein [Candidatus Liberibacter brunswickensis]|uniref:rhamnan synthesis F family protein n=1 Tax=Candidatus Liberibacter brunswickensis TaxID=1968796 RepID=UPI002FE2F44C
MIFFPIVYRLVINVSSRDYSLCNVRMISSKEKKIVIYLPISRYNKYYFLFTSRFERWHFYSDHFSILKVDYCKGFFIWFWTLFYRRRNKLYYYENYVVAYGSRKGNKFFSKSNRYMMKRRLNFDGQKIHNFPRLLHGWEFHVPEKVTRIAIKSKVAIVVHLYYVDLWREIANLLSGLNFYFDLHVTLVADSASIKSEILKKFPNARVYIMENYGRDVLPFLTLLEKEELSCYDYVCKIHGKKSKRKGHTWWEGDLWRRWLFYDLLGAPGVALKIINTFDANPKLGMIGSRAYRYPNRYCNHKSSLGQNSKMISSISDRMGVDFQDKNLDFFAGTMFWARTKALYPLKDIKISRDFNVKVHKSLDGEIEHAIERCFTLSVIKANFCIADVDCVLREQNEEMPQISFSKI